MRAGGAAGSAGRAAGELGAARLPGAWDEFAVTEVAALLGESRGAAEDLLGLARDLEVKLPGTKAAFRDGVLRAAKAEIIVRAVTMLDPAEARKAEAMVLDRAGRLTPGGLRAAIARAVLDVAPKKARKRREEAARDARVQRWAEDSGNAALMGRELPPAEVLAADQRITAWARQLRQPASRATWTCSAPAPTWTSCWARTPGPARTPGRTPLGRTARAAQPGRATVGRTARVAQVRLAAGQGRADRTNPARPGLAGRGGRREAAWCRPGSPGRSP